MTLLERWSRGEALAAAWLVLDSPLAVELVAAAGFDAAVVDMQHGLAHEGSLMAMLQALEGKVAGALVRVPANRPEAIGKALDLGAAGVIVPLVDTPEQASRAVSACRYPPTGSRSYGPIRARLRGSGPVSAATDGIAVFVMIETEAGLSNLESIAATPGLTGLFVGPADLALALGLPPGADVDEPRHAEAVSRILGACRRHGLVCGLYGDDPAFMARAAAQGVGLAVVATDAKLLRSGAAAKLAAFREPR